MQAKVLIVDDDFDSRGIVRLALNTLGYHACLAVNGLEALKYLEAQTFDLLMLDLQMPELDGFGVLRELRKHPQHNAMKIVINSPFDRSVPVLTYIDTKHALVVVLLQLTDCVVNALTVESQAIDHRLCRWQTKYTGFGVAGLGPWQDRANFDKTKTEAAERVDIVTILIESRCQTDGVFEFQTHAFNGKTWLRTKKTCYACNRPQPETFEGQVLGGFRVSRE